MKKKIEFIIGLFVFTALVLLAVMIINFGDYEYKGRQYTVYAVFNYVSGVVEGAPVRYAGVDSGRVAKISLFEDNDGGTKVRLAMTIDEGVNIKNDSIALINSLGIIGEKYVEIFPGHKGAPFLEDGGVIRGTDPVALESVVGNAKRVLAGFENVLDSVNNVLNQNTRENIKQTVVNFKTLGSDLARLSAKAELIIDKINKGEGTAGKFIYAQELHDELLALIKGIREHGIFYKAKSARKEIHKAEGAKRRSFSPRR